MSLQSLATEDAVATSQFLLSPGGVNLFKRLTENRPPLGGKTLEESALNAKEVEGWEKCMASIRLLGELRPESQPEVETLDTATD